MVPAARFLLVVLGLPMLLLGCQSPPQILEISPAKGALDVPTNAPIKIRFDRPLDRASVASRFSLSPAVDGQISWEAQNTLVFRHDNLEPSTQYQVRLVAGYRDGQGSVNEFTHSWIFITEGPPAIRSASPGDRETGVDPATYLTLGFSRDMNADSFRGSVTFSPSVPFSVQADPADGRRVLIAPKSLLEAHADYLVSISGNAVDADGNHLPPLKLHFSTGAVRPLTRWITFIASGTGATPGSGVWMVDDAGFPRNLEETPVEAFSWSPDGTNLLVRHPDRSWTDYPFDSDPVDLTFHADWAVFLGPGAGYVYLDRGRLERLLPDGETVSIAMSVDDAAVSHELNRIAFSQTGPDGADVRAYDVGLRAQYRLQHEVGTVTGLAWAPDGTKLAYLLGAGQPSSALLKVKSLTGSATVNTLATGDISPPAWLADSSDVVFSARVLVSGQLRSRIFRLNTALAPATLTAATALGPVTEEDAFLPRPSPDGHQVAFLLGAAESAQVWLMNADGTGAARLTAFDSSAFPYSCQDLHWASS
jgi:Tol biopolymer transport system component